MKPHSVSAFSAFDDETSVSRSWNVTGMSAFGGLPEWMCHTGLDEPLLAVLALIAFEELLIVIDGARDHIEVEALGRLRLAIHEQRERLRARVAQPFLDGEPIALRLGNLLPFSSRKSS